MLIQNQQTDIQISVVPADRLFHVSEFVPLSITPSAHVLMKYTSAWNKEANCPRLTLRFLLVPHPYTPAAPASVPSFVLDLSVYQTSSPFGPGWSLSSHSLLCHGGHLSIAVYDRVTRNVPKQSIISCPPVGTRPCSELSARAQCPQLVRPAALQRISTTSTQGHLTATFEFNIRISGVQHILAIFKSVNSRA